MEATLDAGAAAAVPGRRPSPRWDQYTRTWYFLRRNTLALVGLGIILFFVAVAIYATALPIPWTSMPQYCGSNQAAIPVPVPPSNTTNITITAMAAGPYSFTVPTIVQATADFVASPSSGGGTLGSTSEVQTIVFSPRSVVTFNENGLYEGTSWSVSLGGATNTTSGTSLVFLEPNGTYDYSIAGVSGYTANVTSGTLLVSGRPISVNVNFGPMRYPFNFYETGLATSTPWSVTVNGTTLSSTSNTVTFPLSNGTYSYTVTPIPGQTTTWTGSVVVNGNQPYYQRVAFNPAKFPVRFTETGLPPSAEWSVTIGGQRNSSDTATITVPEPNGTFGYTVSSPGWAASPAGGNVRIQAAAVSVMVPFSAGYAVTFSEAGLSLPKVISSWSVTANGESVTSKISTLGFVLGNGTYSYAIAPIAGYTTRWSGTVAVHGAPTEVNATFRLLTYNLTFTETGLPAGTSWSVNVTTINATESSTSPNIRFVVPNGTYFYLVLPVAGFVSAPAAGALTQAPVSGVTIPYPVVFRPPQYRVTVSERGLAPGTFWQVGLGNSSNGGLGTQISFSEQNGTYPFTIVAVPGYTATPSSGSLAVSGPTTLTIAFSPPRYAVTFLETGLVAGTNWAVQFGTFIESSNGTALPIPQPNGTYAFTVQTVQGYFAMPRTGSVTVQGAPQFVNLTFALATYPVTFEEQGLPAGANWSGSAGDEPGSSNGTSMTILLPNGTFQYILNPSGAYGPSPAIGELTINAAGVTIPVVFVIAYPVTFQANGLLPGTGWRVALNGSTLGSGTPNITFYQPNGTYAFSIHRVAGYTNPSTTGTIRVSGAAVLEAVPFDAVNLTFHEVGLPAGSYWSIGLKNLTGVPSGCSPVICTYPTGGLPPGPNCYAYPKNAPSAIPPTFRLSPFGFGPLPMGSLTLSISGDYFYNIYPALLRGSDWSLFIAFTVVMSGALIGLLVGAISGFFGGWVDEVIMRFVDAILSIPSILFIIVFLTVIQTVLAADNIVSPSAPLFFLIIAFVLIWWPFYARLVRGQVLVTREQKYVEAARASGAKSGRIIRKHIIPNSVYPIFIQMSLDVGSVPILVGVLVFLGYKILPSNTFPEWGSIAALSASVLGTVENLCEQASNCIIPWWQLLFPGLVLFLFAISVNFFSDGLRDALDPRLRR